MANISQIKLPDNTVYDIKDAGALRTITSSNVTTALGYTPLNSTLKGANNGIAELDANGKVPSSQLPSYVDDVLEYAELSSFPTTGETGKIYIAQDTNKTYRWSGTAYVEISSSLALGTTSSTAYRGDYGNAAYTHAVTNKGAAFTSGLYKITTNSEGHVTAATAVAKADITALGIPGSNTDTHRPIQVNGTQALGNNTTALNLKAGSNVTITDGGSGAITIAATDTNTWRGIQDNLTSSTNTTESLSAKQGYLLANGSARDNTKVPTSMLQVTNATSVGLEPTTNTFGHVNGLTKANWNYQQTDGILYTQFYNASWKHQIFGDYRTGQISIRSKNNGTWQNWRRVLDETNARTLLGVTDNSSNTDVTSSDTNLITARTLYYQLAKKGYTTNTGTVTSVATGVGLTGGTITDSGTLKAKLRSETALTIDSAAATTTSGRVYPVAVDKTGYLAVNVPWTDNNTTYTAATAAPGNIASSSSTGTSTNYARQDHTHGISLATGDSNGQVKIAGTNVSVKGLGTNAYIAAPLFITTSNSYASDALTYDTAITLSAGQLVFVTLNKAMVGSANATLTFGSNNAINIFLNGTAQLKAKYAAGTMLGLIYTGLSLCMINPPAAV